MAVHSRDGARLTVLAQSRWYQTALSPDSARDGADALHSAPGQTHGTDHAGQKERRSTLSQADGRTRVGDDYRGLRGDGHIRHQGQTQRRLTLRPGDGQTSSNDGSQT